MKAGLIGREGRMTMRMTWRLIHCGGRVGLAHEVSPSLKAIIDIFAGKGKGE